MRILIIQHVDFEGRGTILEWASGQGHTISICKPYLGDELTNRTSDFDGLIIMGGPMGVNDTHSFPWLHDEMALILESIEENKKIRSANRTTQTEQQSCI